MHTLPLLALAACTFLLLGLFLGVRHLAAIEPLPRPTRGHRGARRRRALTDTPLWSMAEPVLRWLGACLAPWLPSPLVRYVDRQVVRSGGWLGLCASECVALSLCSAAAGGAAVAWLRESLDLSTWVSVGFVAFTALYPLLRLHAEAKRRLRAITRRLPGAIDLLSLCMGAGMDFFAALELYVNEHARSDEPLVRELEHVLQELSLGRTRREALLAFSARAPTRAVVDFVASLVQAEEKGTPLTEVLAMQAQMLRMQRSVAAEEAAARASVMLVFPMLLLVGCVLFVVLGPFFVSGAFQ